MKKKIKLGRNDYLVNNKPNSFKRYKDLLINKELNVGDEQKQSMNSFKRSSYNSLSKIIQGINGKTKDKASNFLRMTMPMNLYKQDISNLKTKFLISNNNKKSYSRQSILKVNINSIDVKNNNKGTKNLKFYNSNIIKRKKISNLNKLFSSTSRNAINFMDRNRLKATKTINLKLFQKFEEETSKIKENNAKKNEDQINMDSPLNTNNNIKDLLNKEKYEDENKITLKSLNESKIKLFKNKRKSKTLNKIKYSLKKLMEMNPYHLVPKDVRFGDLIEIKKISEQLSHVNGVVQSRATTSQKHFFKNDLNFMNNKISNFNSKIINSVTVTYSNNYSWQKGELVWRILKKMKTISGSSAFRQACLFQGYSELWKYYSMVIEKMLVNYSIYKWFITKEKYMAKEVFIEFIQYMEIKINENKLFPDKVFLLFDTTRSGKINIKIFYFIMEITSNSSSEIDVINFLIELCEDKQKSNYTNVLEMQEMIKSIILYDNNQKNYNILHEVLKNEFYSKNKSEQSTCISKDQLLNFVMNNEIIRKLISLFRKEYKNAYQLYNEEVNSSFNSTIRNVKKFLNEQNEVTRLCKHDIKNYENILKSIQSKRIIMQRNKNYIDSFEFTN